MLALQWPNSFCVQPWHCRSPIPQRFTIHGLWPMDRYGRVMANEIQSGGDHLRAQDVRINALLDYIILTKNYTV